MLPNIIASNTAIIHQSVFSRNQYPDPLPSGAGSTRVFAQRNVIALNHAAIPADVLTLEQHPAPLPSGVGSTDVFSMSNKMNQRSAMVTSSLFIRKQYPEPAPSRIGEEDLAGGFRHAAILSGQHRPLYDLARGIIQIDGVAVLFEAVG